MNQLCQTKPIFKMPKTNLTPCPIMANNNELRTMNYQKRTQTKPTRPERSRRVCSELALSAVEVFIRRVTPHAHLSSTVAHFSSLPSNFVVGGQRNSPCSLPALEMTNSDYPVSNHQLTNSPIRYFFLPFAFFFFGFAFLPDLHPQVLHIFLSFQILCYSSSTFFFPYCAIICCWTLPGTTSYLLSVIE